MPELEAKDFDDFFEEVYFGRLNRNGSRRKPWFHLRMWNVYHRTIQHLPRTKNAIEGFHRRFELMLQLSKPDVGNFWKRDTNNKRFKSSPWLNKKGESGCEIKWESWQNKPNCLFCTRISTIKNFASNCFKHVILRNCFNLLLFICVIVLESV